MLRTQVVKLVRAPIRSFSVAAVRGAEGDTGSARSSGGRPSGDAFSKREAASESMYIRERERENLKQLKEKLKVQRAHLDELDKHIEELEKDKGGEHN